MPEGVDPAAGCAEHDQHCEHSHRDPRFVLLGDRDDGGTASLRGLRHRRRHRCHTTWGCYVLAARLGVALQPLQIGADLGGMLVTQIAVFFQALTDDPFQFGRHVGVQSNGEELGYG